MLIDVLIYPTAFRLNILTYIDIKQLNDDNVHVNALILLAEKALILCMKMLNTCTVPIFHRKIKLEVFVYFDIFV